MGPTPTMSVTEVPERGDGLGDALLRLGDLGVDAAQVLEVLEGQGVASGLHGCRRLGLGEDPFGVVGLEFVG